MRSPPVVNDIFTVAGPEWAAWTAGCYGTQHQLSQLVAGQASVVAAIATGEQAFDDAFDPRHAFGQRLDVFAQIGQIASDLGKVSVDFLSKRLHVSAEFGSQGVSFPPVGTPRRGFR